MRPTKDVRLFFALWPGDEVRNRFVKNIARFNLDPDQSRLVTTANLHLTLHFIGNSTLDEMNCLRRQARHVHARAFDLIVDTSGYFRKPKVLWFGSRKAPAPLQELQQTLGKNIAECGYQPEARPYSPHLTVARKIPRAPEPVALEPVYWRVERFVLVESVSVEGGVRYEVVEVYPLIAG